MTNQFASENHVTASVDDVENFIRGYIEANDAGTRIKRDEKVAGKSRIIDLFLHNYTGLWGSILLIAENDSILFTTGITDGILSRRDERVYQRLLDELEAKILKRFGKPQEPIKPPLPKGEGGNIEAWLIWRNEMLTNGYKCTLLDVAAKSGYSEGYIKQRSMTFKNT